MTNYRRVRIPGAKYFFTVSLADRSSDLLIREVAHLRSAFAATQRERPFWCDAFVVLPDHLHAVWTMPPGDADYSTRWRLIKSRFVRITGEIGPRSGSKIVKRERGIWQRRFWEHTIRDERDYRSHMAYCWGNPVKHGLVEHPTDWPYSSIHRDIRTGRVDPEWSGGVTVGKFGEP
ncbi:REP-associated tyrosine transposase [Ruegeria atlantica]|uniref:REP-associated tyrosine transposase n=1 Tax=Ruegeria atlantica TaxID=81569 RepID=UPI00147C0CF6|nr:transposase [Ruegeria atlantica]